MENTIKIKEPVAILGYGVEGKAALEFLQSHGVKDITICDQNPDADVPRGFEVKLGKSAFDDLKLYQTIVRSPGIPHDLPSLQEAGGSVTSTTNWTMQAASDRATVITGSNGKTTTTALTQKILEAHYGDKLITGGNDRQPVLLDAIHRPEDPILMEASSFQFADVHKSPYIAAILNITPNHMDWHENFDDYVTAKSHVLRYQQKDDWAVLNANDENTAKLDTATPAQRFWVGQKRGSNWAVWEKGHLLLTFDDKTEILLHRDDLRVKTHPDNILFASAIGNLHIVPPSTIREQIKLFNGVEHRMEYIRTVKDIHFYNDTASTTPESTEIAVNLFPHDKLILMLGGSSKKSDFSALAQHIVDNDIRVYLYGKEADVIASALKALGGEYLIIANNKSTDFKTIVNDVFGKAKPKTTLSSRQPVRVLTCLKTLNIAENNLKKL